MSSNLLIRRAAYYYNLDARYNRAIRIYKRVQGRSVFVDEVCAETVAQAIELVRRGIHGGEVSDYFTQEETDCGKHR